MIYSSKTNPKGAKAAASYGASLLPYVGDAKDVQEALSGRDLITGKKLSKGDRAVTSVAAVLPVVSGTMLKSAGEGVKIAAKEVPKTGSKIAKKAEPVVKKATKKTDVAVDTAKKLKNKAVKALKGAGKKADSKAEKAVEKIKETEKAVGKSSLNSLSKPNSKKLRINMINSGVNVPNYPNAAHHIVAGNSKKAEQAREILQKYGVDVNAADNGVFLPTNKGISNSAYHPSLHTDSYYRKVTEQLSQATSKQDVQDILADIAEQLKMGKF